MKLARQRVFCAMHILIVDDEPLARRRLRVLLDDCNDPARPFTVHEAASVEQARGILLRNPVNLLLLDIQMPGASGIELAQILRRQPDAPSVVFVTAHAAHAVQAFELDACDYLTKPVRLQRLQQAIAKVRRLHDAATATASVMVQHPSPESRPAIVHAHERGHDVQIPLEQVVYCRAEQKYVTIHTLRRSFVVEESLNLLEQRHPQELLRVHRNTLVNPAHMCALHRHHDDDQGEYWALHLHSVPDWLPVSRRQLSAVRAALAQRSGAAVCDSSPTRRGPSG